jgi:diguanylate cyclase (GGDEF)-like protein
MPSKKNNFILRIFSSFLFLVITYIIILTFGLISEPTHNQNQQVTLSILLASYLSPLTLIWISAMPVWSLTLSGVAIIFSILTALKTLNIGFIFFGAYFMAVMAILFFYRRYTKETVVMHELEIERTIKERNILEEEFKKKNKALEIFLHKYADYANLRSVIENFSSTLSLDKICSVIVGATLNAIGKGDRVYLYLIDLDENSLCLRATKSIDRKRRSKNKKGDIFDQWVLKHIQQLMVNDITTDVRFDFQQNRIGDDLKSLMVAPLMYESRVVGTLRINSDLADVFTIEDFRVFTIIANLASAAVSNAILYQKTEELAIKDSLTGLFVHRYFRERLKEEYKRSLLTNAPLTLIMTDLDNFKSYNDQYGHTAGDLILKRVSQILFSIFNEEAIVARYGGEEFVVLIPKATSDDVLTDAEEVRKIIAAEAFELRGIKTKITLSMGIASIPADTLDSEELIKIADERLYAAKRSGKNTIKVKTETKQNEDA